MDAVTRGVIEGVGPGGIDVREYRHEDKDVKLPSVTTVLKTRDDDKSNLYAWQDRNDGEGDNPYHEHLFWYKRHRGTLCHWHALSQLDPSLEWTDDEGQSDEELRAQNEPEVCNDSPREVLYSVLKSNHAVESWGEFYDRYEPYKSHEYYADALYEQCERDIAYFLEAFETIRERLDVTTEDVIAVEEFLFNAEDGYAGQVDLVYECPTTGDTVVADLKTSSGCYDKHKMQGAAYGNSVERLLDLDVGRIEVWRIHPDSGQWAVHAPREPTDIHTSEWWRKDYDALLEEFLELAHNFEYDIE